MKMKIRPDDASMLQMNDWLAELREGGWAAPPGGSAGSGDPRPDAPGQTPRARRLGVPGRRGLLPRLCPGLRPRLLRTRRLRTRRLRTSGLLTPGLRYAP